MAAESVLESTYMDDSMDSVPNDSSDVELHKQLSDLWGKASMQAREWLSNSEEALKTIPPEDRALKVDLVKEHLPSLKTLGVLWLANKMYSPTKQVPLMETFSSQRETSSRKLRPCLIQWFF